MNCYLKVNIDTINTYNNLGHWISSFLQIPDCKLYLLCDNQIVQDKIREIYLNIDEIIEVIPSIRNEPLIKKYQKKFFLMDGKILDVLI